MLLEKVAQKGAGTWFPVHGRVDRIAVEAVLTRHIPFRTPTYEHLCTYLRHHYGQFQRAD